MKENRAMPWRYVVLGLSSFALFVGSGFLGRLLAPFGGSRPEIGFGPGLFGGFIIGAFLFLGVGPCISEDETERKARRNQAKRKAEEEEERLMKSEGLR